MAAACTAALIVGAGGLSSGSGIVILEGAADEAVSLSRPTETLLINLDGFGSARAAAGSDRTVDDEIGVDDEIDVTTTSVTDYEWMPPEVEPRRVAVLIVQHFDFQVDGELHVYEMKGNRLRRSRRAASDLR